MKREVFERKRAKIVERVPAGYDGRLHVLWFNVLALGVVVTCLALLEGPSPAEWLMVPGFLVFANGFEWWYHKGPLHKKYPFLEDGFKAHTHEHHVMFVEEDMALRSHEELHHVLFGWWFIPGVMLGLAPIPLALATFGSRDLALLFYATGLFYFWVYEWLHLLHHAPPETWPARTRWATVLRRHHARHHNPPLMAKANFNISVPLWDWILGTMAPPLDGGA